MTKNNLMTLLKHWMVCESCIDLSGNINPSRLALHIVHCYFIKKAKFTKSIESAKSDQQGGIIVEFYSNDTRYRFIIHALFDGIVDYYQVSKDNTYTKERLYLKENKEGLGTDQYKFD